MPRPASKEGVRLGGLIKYAQNCTKPLHSGEAWTAEARACLIFHSGRLHTVSSRLFVLAPCRTKGVVEQTTGVKAECNFCPGICFSVSPCLPD